MDKARTTSSPRHLLARVRDIMATRRQAQDRLNEIVVAIAEAMSAEVCSVYVRRAGEVLELFATHGLKSTAVHMTRLRIGEGLVGLVAARARPVALSDAQKHPDFAYRPETGERIFHSLMGVPILRGGQVMGVLVVQNRTRRRYAAEEIEILETVSMVLAEMVGGGELINKAELQPAESGTSVPRQMTGVRLSAGMGMGLAVLSRPRPQVRRLVAENTEDEHRRLRTAVSEMQSALDRMLRAEDVANGGEHRDILESYRMIAEDAGWLARIDEAIVGGLTAEAAVMKVHNDIRARMSAVSDPYLRERVHDLEDLAERLLRHLTGGEEEAFPTAPLPDEMILVARNLGPARLLEYDRARLKGVILEEGSATMHTAILARALDIPVVGQVKDALERVDEGDQVIVDADNATVIFRPGETVQKTFIESLEERAQRQAAFAALRNLPAVTRDGVRVSLNINAGLRVDMPQLEARGADGVGLYRTEILFMTGPDFPDSAAQEAVYRDVLDHAGERPVIFRTVDVGGDKILPYWDHCGGDNPAMGWRAIRICLDRPAILRHQLRALIRAAAGRDLRVMFPMVAQVSEFDSLRALLDMELARERERGGTPPSELHVGAMLEVPSLLFQLPALLERVEFLSIGSNDLMQFLYASDRGNPSVAERYDTLSPPVLAMLRDLRARCEEAGVALGVCGEMAGQPLEAMALLGLGYRTLSMAPSSVGPVKAMVRSLSVADLEGYLSGLCASPERSVRPLLRDFARDHGVAF